jgi:hypothetical protein
VQVLETIGYCTNVHAGLTWSAARANLEKFACSVRDQRGPDASLGVGIWLPETAVQEILSTGLVDEIRRWLDRERLIPFTMNGFPQGDFHQAVVKHRVYEPTWWDESRLQYTQGLADILCQLLPKGATGSISTLPIGWGSPKPDDQLMERAAGHLRELARYLAEIEQRSGRRIIVAIEAEPGCVLGDCVSMRDFFERYLLSTTDAELHRRYLTICHDVCHSAVMREDQKNELRAYRDLGIQIGKVQVSSAIEADWDSMSSSDKNLALQQLRTFAEDRYLHQTSVVVNGTTPTRLVEDLPQLLATVESAERLTGSWRVHFHVPIFLERFGKLKSTQPEIEKCVRELLASGDGENFSGHWEVETYAWGVLPPEIAMADLAQGIAKEMAWFRDLLARIAQRWSNLPNRKL